MVTVLEVDMERRRISLSMRQNPEDAANGQPSSRPEKSKPKKKNGGAKRQEPAPFNNPFANLLTRK